MCFLLLHMQYAASQWCCSCLYVELSLPRLPVRDVAVLGLCISNCAPPSCLPGILRRILSDRWPLAHMSTSSFTRAIPSAIFLQCCIDSVAGAALLLTPIAVVAAALQRYDYRRQVPVELRCYYIVILILISSACSITGVCS